MNGRRIFTIYGKELRDMLRDRRTLVSMIVIPTLLMPLIVGLVVFVSVKVIRQARAEAPVVMVAGGADSPVARAALLAHGKIRAVRATVEFPAGFDAALERGEPAAVKIFHYEGELRSGFAVSEIQRFFSDYRERIVTARLAGRGLAPTFVKPFAVQVENVAPPEKVGGNVIGGIIPYMFLLLCFTGAMYPAMDLTAGEKERGTMETILCSPVSRLELVLGKFLMVLTASLGTVLCSLISMVGTVSLGGPLLVAMVGANRGAGAAAALPSLDPLGLLAVLVLVLPMAVFFSALLLAISLVAKSFKEAQSYLSPLVIVIILPAVAGVLPGVELNGQLALVPILNVSLASKELVSGVWHWPHLALIFGSTSVYAALALAWAVRMFNREDVIFRT
jgi:sodium transport system permease protein